ncbi:radical SAM protein [Butyrivibrio sp. MC2021]|uniref:radical SAM protein n=1 Tax=Butyrivibrio sp. MC2021 TaxID=1408306 RepID=UPI0006885901|nr:radical SAM protein [Butyrivibrio sp. MC2021]
MGKKPYISLILTKRCNAKCQMCNCHLNPTKPEDEFSPALIDKLPKMKSTTLTGGEPFLRNDIEEVLKKLQGKTDRILINTNGYYTERICEVCAEFPGVGVRISIDGSEKTHNEIRGVPDIYDHAMDTIDKLIKIRGKHDLGIGFCIQDRNYTELIPMFEWAENHGLEFGFSVVQNSSFFNKADNVINNQDNIVNELEKLKRGYLETNNPRKWARAYFTDGAIKYVLNVKKPLTCDAGRSSFFVSAYGDVMPCNDFPKDMIMGNLNNMSWTEIMNSDQGKSIVRMCEKCSANCWSICNMGSQMRRNICKIVLWIVRNKVL